jgi:hypothetical protein
MQLSAYFRMNQPFSHLVLLSNAQIQGVLSKSRPGSKAVGPGWPGHGMRGQSAAATALSRDNTAL